MEKDEKIRLILDKSDDNEFYSMVNWFTGYDRVELANNIIGLDERLKDSFINTFGVLFGIKK
jgi:hypothetical protein